MERKYLDEQGMGRFLSNLKNLFSLKSHSHTKNDITDFPTIPTKVSQLTNDKNFTSNIGTITGIKMNGVSKGTSGVVDLGTVVTGGSQTTTSTADGGSNVFTFSNGSTITVKNGTKGSTGATGSPGVAGKNGSNGVSCTHSWNGTTLTVTSASGTSSANLKGTTGDRGATGATGAAGKNGTNGTSAAWFTGTAVTGTSTSAVSVSVSGSKANDMYLNTSTCNVYRASAANSWIYVCNIKGATGSKGDKGVAGTNGITPTIKVAAGSNIGVVGTPTVTASTSGTTTTFIFNNLKGVKGDKGDRGANGTNATTTAVATTNANGLMSASDKSKLNDTRREIVSTSEPIGQSVYDYWLKTY